MCSAQTEQTRRELDMAGGSGDSLVWWRGAEWSERVRAEAETSPQSGENYRMSGKNGCWIVHNIPSTTPVFKSGFLLSLLSGCTSFPTGNHTHFDVIGSLAIVSPWPCTHQPDCQAWSRPPRVSFCIPMHIVEQLYLLFMESFQVLKNLSCHRPSHYKIQKIYV